MYVLYCNQCVIERVIVTRFLGVLVDEKLSWKQHIKGLDSKLVKCTSIIYRASTFLESTTLQTLYNSMFLPHISYFVEIWGNASKRNLQCVNIAKKKEL